MNMHISVAPARPRLGLVVFFVIAFGVPWVGWFALRRTVGLDHMFDSIGLYWFTAAPSLAGFIAAFAEDGVIHAGNASQISDGSAALLFMSAEKAKSLGLKPIAKVHTATLAGADPVIMLTAPIPATQKVLKRSGLSIGDIGAYEVNEAFAPVPLAWLKDIGADEKKLNPNGGAIALGHPLGGSGARIMTTMLYHMRDKGIRYGLQTMCEGGGQANATIVELL